jgi:hypothetical protein
MIATLIGPVEVKTVDEFEFKVGQRFHSVMVNQDVVIRSMSADDSQDIEYGVYHHGSRRWIDGYEFGGIGSSHIWAHMRATGELVLMGGRFAV